MSDTDERCDDLLKNCQPLVTNVIKTQTCKDKKHQDLRTIVSLEICRTGKKKQFYTLYSSCLLTRKYEKYSERKFVKNLSHCKHKAQVKAHAYARSMNTLEYDELRTLFYDSPRPIYSKYIAFGNIHMSMSTNRKIWYGTPNQTFWNIWKIDAQGVRDAGFWVKKNSDKTWTLFRHINPSEIIWWNQ